MGGEGEGEGEGEGAGWKLRDSVDNGGIQRIKEGVWGVYCSSSGR